MVDWNADLILIASYTDVFLRCLIDILRRMIQSNFPGHLNMYNPYLRSLLESFLLFHPQLALRLSGIDEAEQ